MIIKKALFIIFSIFLTYQSYKLIVVIDEVSNSSWANSIMFALLFNLFITGIFAFLGFALPTQKILPNSYYEIKNSKKLTFIYNVFKVDWFRNFLLLTFWKNKKQRRKYFNGKLNGIRNFIVQTKKSEFGHLLPFVFILILSAFLFLKGLQKLAIITFAVNWIFNWYPIILQRHHRMRIQRLYNVLKAKSNSKKQ